jgi:hypothetical protein
MTPLAAKPIWNGAPYFIHDMQNALTLLQKAGKYALTLCNVQALHIVGTRKMVGENATGISCIKQAITYRAAS